MTRVEDITIDYSDGKLVGLHPTPSRTYFTHYQWQKPLSRRTRYKEKAPTVASNDIDSSMEVRLSKRGSTG